MKILVPVDGSEYSLRALDKASDLAMGQPFSSLILMAVAIELPELEEGRYIADKMKNQAEAALAQARKLAEAKGSWAKIDTILATGPSAADEIVQVAKDEEAGLIVIGSRGLAGKTMSFLGSTASKVVTYSTCSVMVVKD